MRPMRRALRPAHCARPPTSDVGPPRLLTSHFLTHFPHSQQLIAAHRSSFIAHSEPRDPETRHLVESGHEAEMRAGPRGRGHGRGARARALWRFKRAALPRERSAARDMYIKKRAARPSFFLGVCLLTSATAGTSQKARDVPPRRVGRMGSVKNKKQQGSKQAKGSSNFRNRRDHRRPVTCHLEGLAEWDQLKAAGGGRQRLT